MQIVRDISSGLATVEDLRKVGTVDVRIGYRKQNREVNELYDAFSRMTKKIDLVRMAMLMGTGDNRTLLEFNEGVQLFSTQEGAHVQVGRCYNNIGNIMVKMKHYADMIPYFEQAIHI